MHERNTYFKTDALKDTWGKTTDTFSFLQCNLFYVLVKTYLSRRMGKPTTCIGENKGTDQLRSNCETNQRLCFRYTDSTIPLFSKSKISSLCDCTARFVLDLVGTQIVGFLMHRLICICMNTCSPVLTFSTAVCVSRVVDQTNANHSKISISIVNFQERQKYFISIYFILPLSMKFLKVCGIPSIRKTCTYDKQRFFF